MQSNNNKEVIEGVSRVGVFFLICLVTALIGSSAPGWLFLFMPVAVGGFAFWISDFGGKYAAFGAGIGLLAATLWNFFGV